MANNWFIKLGDNIKGESQKEGFKDQIEMLNVAWGASNPTTVKSSGGLSGGVPQLTDITFARNTDSASTFIMDAIVRGTHIPTVTITGTKSTGKASPEKFIEITLEDVLVTSYQLSSSYEVPMESISLNFKKITSAYSIQNEQNVLNQSGSVTWDSSLAKAE
jgi:type VI secretion system secreted protein Hcp